MRIKKIIGWKDIEQDNIIEKDNIYPFCKNETLCIPIEIYNEGIFRKISRFTEYTCDKCGCIWRVKNEM